MECPQARRALLDQQRGRLSAETGAELAAHLEACPACRKESAAEAALSELLARQLPRYPAPADLKRRVFERPPAERHRDQAPPPAAKRRARWLAPAASALVAAALVLAGVRVLQPSFLRSRLIDSDLVEEAVNDHLRVVTSVHPVEIESGGIHQVKPWFTGRLDFAPQVAFTGDEQFHLEGGSVGYFRDRKAAVFVFKVRLHTVTLLVFRADGLPWRGRGLEQVGPIAADARVNRGFNVLLWRQGELGYCLISDVGRADLDALAARVAGGGH
jgi:anti-sigma factor RsiW